MLPPPAPPPFSRLEWLFLRSGYDVHAGGFDEQVERVRRWLRAEVDRRLRELAKTEPIPFPCPNCGELVEVSSSYHEKVRSGRVAAPLCFECKRPKQVEQAEVEAARFIELLADSSEELAAAVVALR